MLSVRCQHVVGLDGPTPCLSWELKSAYAVQAVEIVPSLFLPPHIPLPEKLGVHLPATPPLCLAPATVQITAKGSVRAKTRPSQISSEEAAGQPGAWSLQEQAGAWESPVASALMVCSAQPGPGTPFRLVCVVDVRRLNMDFPVPPSFLCLRKRVCIKGGVP